MDQLNQLLEDELALPTSPSKHTRTAQRTLTATTASEAEFRKKLNTSAFNEDIDKVTGHDLGTNRK